MGCLCRGGKRLFVLPTRATWGNFSPSQRTWWRRAADIFMRPSALLSFLSAFYFLKTAKIGFISRCTTALTLFVWECASVRVPSSLPFLLLLLLLLSSTRPPPHTPPIIEADSASRACTRHTRWLQHLERCLGHYSTPHTPGKGGEEGTRRRRRSSRDKKLIWQVIYALPSLSNGV